MRQDKFDVVVVGASVGGCTAAIRFAQCGLSVALLERTTDPNQYKKVCTHFLQPAGMQVLRKLNLIEPLEAAGAVRNDLEVCTPWGWIRTEHSQHVGQGYNIRRETFDPILRQRAVETPGVRYFAGYAVHDLLHDATQRVTGLVARTAAGTHAFHSGLVVAADGRNSSIAKLAETPLRQHANDRFTFFTYYRGVQLHNNATAQYWTLLPNLCYAFRCDDNTTLLGVWIPRDQLTAFQQDPAANFRRFWEMVPDAPKIGDRQPICELRGITKIPNQWRPASAPGLAFVGDAATVMDPIWGTGCCFAMLSADWLVEATAPILCRWRGRFDQQGNLGPRQRREAAADLACLDKSLLRYRKRHRRETRGHYLHTASFASNRKFWWLEKLVLSAGTRDAASADRVLKYLGRSVGPMHVFSPAGLLRAGLANLGWLGQPRPQKQRSSSVRNVLPISPGPLGPVDVMR